MNVNDRYMSVSLRKFLCDDLVISVKLYSTSMLSFFLTVSKNIFHLF